MNSTSPPLPENPHDPVDQTDENSIEQHVLDPEIRVGSPFAVDPPMAAGRTALTGEAFYDIGPARYMAWGAVFASAVILLFAAASAYWFPAGGLLVAALGGLLGITGLFSPRPIVSSLLLFSHLSMFLLAAYRWSL